MQDPSAEFPAIHRLEEAIMKSRAVSFLLSRYLVQMDEDMLPSSSMAADIQVLADSVSDEVDTRFKEASAAVFKSAAATANSGA
jgi:hypothetical protein